MKKLFWLFLLILSAGTLPCQQNNENYNALLWRITGNGLTKPSYVFGTIHIADKRVFHFTDSLYKSLEQSEGFATELDMGTIMSAYLKQAIDEDEEEDDDAEKEEGSGKYLVDVMDKKLIDKYKSALEEKFRKPIDKIKMRELDKMKDDWMGEVLKKGEMNTFMDAYLFDIARRQGKWVGGIEDPEDQFGLNDKISIEEKLESLDTDSKTMEWMISTYLKQDLDAIERSEEMLPVSKDVILIKRNIKMARRIDSLSHIRSMLFAIGAAHIPGPEGVINLLRQKGFMVTPVFSNNRIAPEDYSYSQIDLPWVDAGITDSLYTIKTPGKAEVYSMTDIPLDMKFYLDMGSMRVYFTVAIPMQQDVKDHDSIMNNLISYYTKKGINTKPKEVTVNGIAGKEITSTSDEAEIRMQVFVNETFVALNLISAAKKSSLYGPEPEKFFQSFKVTPKPKLVTGKKDYWQKFKFEKLGFSIELPGKFTQRKEKSTDEAWDQHLFESFDMLGRTYYGMAIATVRKGYYSSSDSALFEQTTETILSNMNGEKISSEHFQRDGYPAYKFLGKAVSEKQTVILKMLFINKGPRRYFLLTTSENIGDPEDAGKRFFESFDFLPEENSKWKKEFPADKSFSTWAPSSIIKDSEQEKKEIKYSVLDTNTHVQVFIDKEIFPDYFWAKDDTTLMADKINTFISYNDSVIMNSQFKNGNIPGADLLVQLPGTHNQKRLRALLNKDTLYTIYTFLPSQTLETENYKKLFSEFKINHESVSSSLYKRKPKELLLALQTKDSAGFENAKTVFEYVTFIPEDVPLLQQALLHTYYDFDTNYYYSLSNSISAQLLSLDSSYSSIGFIKDNYSKLSGGNELLKPYLLGLLSEFKTKGSYDLLKELMIESPPNISAEYYFKNGFYDSLQLTQALYPEILSLMDDPGLYEIISELSVTMFDSNLIDVATLREYKDAIINCSKRILSLPSESLKENYYRYSNLIKLLGKINRPETNELVKQFSRIDANSIKLDVVLALAANNSDPDPKDIMNLAKDDEYRVLLYNQLKDLNKQALFPKTYLTQRWLAQSHMFEYANEDDYPPDSIEFIGERVETYLGKKQKFYLFKICFESGEGSDAECYFGVAGPYSLDPKDHETKNEVTEVYWDESFDDTKKIEWLKEMITKTEEWLKKQK